MPDIPEKDQVTLIQQIATGDADALGRLYGSLRAPLNSMAYRMLTNRFEAEEVIQDVFVLVWKNAHKFDPQQAKVFTWLCMMVRNRCIDRMRSNSRRLPSVTPNTKYTTVNEQAIVKKTAADHMQTQERAGQVRRAIDQLPKEQGQVIYLAFYGGMTHAQIADKLDISLGTTKSRIRYGFERLSTLLADEPKDTLGKKDMGLPKET